METVQKCKSREKFFQVCNFFLLIDDKKNVNHGDITSPVKTTC